ncbi:MAG: hypothetical protein J0I21_10490 [Alphaproteobacteria bacterium]|nr:hypothetical protein [Alphaproteobacteria bacterium]
MRRFFITALAVALASLGLMLLIPHDRYIQAQDVRVGAFARLGWIYERIHFDPTPIDVAFIGTSHTMNGVNGAVVSAGLSRMSGHPVYVANLAIPQYGRNFHWLLVRELLEHRKVKTLVLEVTENESRQPHPLFAYWADVSDVLEAPVLINLNWFTDIARLPLRQLTLGVKTLFPEEFGLRRHFDPAAYDGSDVDNTDAVQVHGKTLTHLRRVRIDPTVLAEEAAAFERNKRLHMLGEELDSLEYHLPRYYLDKILALAREKGVQVKFLYLPVFGQPHQPYDMSPYVGQGQMLYVDDILADPANWFDLNHLNSFGAAKLSKRLPRLLSESFAGDPTVR